MIYRGQAYGQPVGEWWTTSAEEAQCFAMSAGSNRNWIVLAIDEDIYLSGTTGERWLEKFCTTHEHVFEGATHFWYRIPIAKLKEHWLGVTIVKGAINLDWKQPKCADACTCGSPRVEITTKGDETFYPMTGCLTCSKWDNLPQMRHP